MHTFKYLIELEEGYYPVMEDEPQYDVLISVEAENRVTANRMVKAMLKGATNILDCDGLILDR